VLVTAVLRPDGGSDLRIMRLSGGEDRLVYACPDRVRCQAPALSPSADFVAFEMLAVEGGTAAVPVLGPSQVWVVGTAAGSKPFAVGDPADVTVLPTWSPTGLLAFDDATAGAIIIKDPKRGPTGAPMTQFASALGEVGSWSPDGMSLVFPEVIFPPTTSTPPAGSTGESAPVFFSHLNRADIGQGTIVDLTGETAGLVEDASPAFSPDGAWIAFARKFLDSTRWSLGRQLWLMHPDGSGARALTHEASFNHSAIAWEPSSGMLAYMRFNMADPGQPAEIWWMNLDRGEGHLLIAGGYQPRWIP
jgi:Tol biopolymer transport system component